MYREDTDENKTNTIVKKKHKENTKKHMKNTLIKSIKT